MSAEIDVLNPEKPKGANIKELFEKLSSTKRGLSASEAKERLQQYGYGAGLPGSGKDREIERRLNSQGHRHRQCKAGQKNSAK